MYSSSRLFHEQIQKLHISRFFFQTNQYQKTRHIQPQKYSDSEGSSSHSVSPSSSSNTSSFSSADSGNPEFGFRIWQSGSGSGLNIKNEKVEFPPPNNDSTKFLNQKQHHQQKRPEDQEILRQNEGHHQHGLFHNNSYISIPGIQFDAKSRSFSEDELRPQPIIRKRKKVRVFFHFFLSIFWQLFDDVANQTLKNHQIRQKI